MNKPQNHKKAVNKVLLECGDRGWMAWENKTGVAWTKGRGHRRPRPIAYGLPGSTDIIGISPHVVTVDDVGKTIGVFLGIEVKMDQDVLQENQKAFRDRVIELGGVYVLRRIFSDQLDDEEP